MKVITLLLLCAIMISCQREKRDLKKFTEIPPDDARSMIDHFYDSLSPEQQKSTLIMNFNLEAIGELLKEHKGADTFSICFAAFDSASAAKYAASHKVRFEAVVNHPTVLFALPKQGAYEKSYYMEATICPPPMSCNRYAD